MSQSNEPWSGKAASAWPVSHTQAACQQAALRKGGKWRVVTFLSTDSIRMAEEPDAPIMTVRARYFLRKTMGAYQVQLRWTARDGRKRKGISVMRLYTS
jgi:hypothetical protein